MPSSDRINWIHPKTTPTAAKLVERIARMIAPGLIGAPFEYLDLEDRAVLRAFATRKVTEWASQPQMPLPTGHDVVFVPPADGEVVDGEVVEDSGARDGIRDPYSLDRDVTIRGTATRRGVLRAPKTDLPDLTVFLAVGGMLVQLDHVRVVFER